MMIQGWNVLSFSDEGLILKTLGPHITTLMKKNVYLEFNKLQFVPSH